MPKQTTKRAGSPLSDLRIAKRPRAASFSAPSTRRVDQGPHGVAIDQSDAKIIENREDGTSSIFPHLIHKVTQYVAALKSKSTQATNRDQDASSFRATEPTYQFSGFTCIDEPAANHKKSYQSSGWTCVNDPTATCATATNPQADVIRRLSMDEYEWSDEEKKKVALWMKMNQARNVTGKKKEFDELLTALYFKFPVVENDSEEVINEKAYMEAVLRKKTLDKMFSLWLSMKKHGAVIHTAKISKGARKRELVGVLTFADWTSAWLETDWDGSFIMPRYYVPQTVEVQFNEEDLGEEALFITE